MNRVVAVVLMFAGAALAWGGTNGTIEGTVKDKNSAEAVPGATVMIVGTQRGATSDENGRFIIANIRAGRYDIRVAHVGYQSRLMRHVLINPDLRTRLVIELEPTDVLMDEITVTLEKPLIQRDVTGTTYFMSGADAALLPLENAIDAVRLKPGIPTQEFPVVYTLFDTPIPDPTAKRP
jgi:hypothetical protein